MVSSPSLRIYSNRLTLQDDALLPLQLLVFALETALTTLTSTLEMLSWEGYTSAEQQRLCGLYLPYLALCKD